MLVVPKVPRIAEQKIGMVWQSRRCARELTRPDVNVDYVGRDGVRDMHEVPRCDKCYAADARFHGMGKMEAGLKAGGKCLLNSTNYEDGEPGFEGVGIGSGSMVQGGGD